MQGYGLLQVYTGTGKGKTTAALGVILRAAGKGAKSLMLQFMKDDPEYGEFTAASFIPDFTLRQVGRDSFVNFQDPDPIDVRLIEEGWKMGKEAISSGKYDIVVLDEINIALHYGLLDTDEVIAFLANKKGNTEVICTGRYAPVELIRIADLVTDMDNKKHYFFAGKESRSGIDH